MYSSRRCHQHDSNYNTTRNVKSQLTFVISKINISTLFPLKYPLQNRYNARMCHIIIIIGSLFLPHCFVKMLKNSLHTLWTAPIDYLLTRRQGRMALDGMGSTRAALKSWLRACFEPLQQSYVVSGFDLPGGSEGSNPLASFFGPLTSSL